MLRIVKIIRLKNEIRKQINADLFYTLHSELLRVEKERLEIEKKRRFKIEYDRY